MSRSPTAWTLAASGLVAALLLHTVADPDLWGHLAFGRQTLLHGLGRTDAFSYTAPGVPVLNHEWLSDVVTYALFRLAGPAAVVALRLSLLGGMLFLVAGAVRRAGGDALAAALVAALVVLGGFPWFVTARPQLYTFVCFAAFLVAIERADAGDVRPLLVTPLVTLAWVNLHGGVVAGLGVLGCWAAFRLGQAVLAALCIPLPAGLARGTPAGRMAWTLVLVLALHVPAALASPFGTALWRFFAETLSVRRVEISEWQHVSPTDLGDVFGGLVLATMAVLIARSARPRDPVHLAILALLVAAGVGARRHLALAVIAAGVLGAPHAVAALAKPASTSQAGRAARAMPAAALVLVAVLASVGLTRAGCIVVEPGTVPRAAVEYLKAARVEGKLAVLFDWGSYAIWHLAPHLQVSIDGRREAVYSPAQLAENEAFLYGWPGWRVPLDRDAVDLALVSPRFAVYGRLVAEPDWRLAFADDIAALFVRRGSAADASFARTPRPPAVAAPLCLTRAG